MTKPTSTFRIVFCFSENGKLRVKQRDVEAKTLNDAIEKLKGEFDFPIKVTSCQRL